VTQSPARVLAPPPARNGLPYGIVFVCTGNICRSPIAEVITRSLAADTTLSDGSTLAAHLHLSSAGTGPWHEGEPMHDYSAATLERGGYPSHPHVAHQFSTRRLRHYDLIVPLDRRHQQTLRSLGADPDRIALLRSFDPASGAATDVPDPYYGDHATFDECRDMIAAGCRGLVASLTTHWEDIAGS
jgi:protein-tyrosine phosphatase